MAYLITRMPSTGSMTDVTYTSRPVKELRDDWADDPNVEVMSDDDYNVHHPNDLDDNPPRSRRG